MKPSFKLRHFLLLAAATLPIGMARAETINLDLATNSSGGIVLSDGTTYTFGFSISGARYLIVGGGGGGGAGSNHNSNAGGGGGAGGLLTATGATISGEALTVTVGDGGQGGIVGGTAATRTGTSGQNSSAFGFIANGGGGGGTYDANALTGGSGGGAGSRSSQTDPGDNGGTGTSGQGNAGGNRVGTSSGAASGGGAGGAGNNGGGSGTGAAGGSGASNNITGSNVTYAAGGGGGGATGGSSQTGGNGGGGNNSAASATANTGGGGGGAGNTNSNGTRGGKGGSGIVVVRYATSQGLTGALTGGTVTTDDTDTVHTFTTTGASALDLHSATIAGDISGTGNINWNKTGTLTLSGTNTYDGTTTVSTGTLEVTGTGSINDSTSLTVASGATFRYNSSTALSVGSITNNGAIQISGTGDIGVDLGLNSTSDILSPGNSPGVQNYTVSQTWSSFTYEWETNNFTGTTAGTDFDQITIDGNLTLTGSTVGSYVLDLISLTNLDVEGDVFNFAETSRSWDILTTSGTISGFDLSYWNIDGSAFTSNPAWQGNWNLGVNGTNNALVLSYTAIPEPSAALLGGIGFLLLLRRRR